jgi:hypothetical protein
MSSLADRSVSDSLGWFAIGGRLGYLGAERSDDEGEVRYSRVEGKKGAFIGGEEAKGE